MNYENASLISTDSDLDDTEYAGFWIRFGASLIDGFVLGIPIGLFTIIFISIYSMNNVGEMTLAPLLLMYSIDIVAVLLYYILLTSGKHQGTVGKMMVGIKVVDRFGKPIGKGRALGRFLSCYLSGFFYIGYIIAAFTPKKQALHDYIASTYVVKK